MKNKKYKKKNKSSALTIIIIIAIVLVGGWFLFRGRGSSEPIEIISKNGIHWHSRISIRVKGENIPIPANIGISGVHNPIHTHDADGVVHLEFSGIVADRNLRLKEFFRVWGKKFNKECIFDNCNGPGGQVKMLVNGEPNAEFENYIMKDGDVIEIIYE